MAHLRIMAKIGPRGVLDIEVDGARANGQAFSGRRQLVSQSADDVPLEIGRALRALGFSVTATGA